MFREHKDKLVVGHIENAKKNYLPFNYRPQYLKDIYSSKIIGLPKETASYISTDIATCGKASTKEALWTLAETVGATVIVTGMHGRKGLKA